MKALKIIILSIAILLPTSAFSGETGALWISLIDGEAYLYTEDDGDWLEASVNMPLAEGDTLWVSGDGRAELHIAGSGYLRLEGRTMLDVLKVDDGPAEFSLTEGRLYINAEGDDTPVLIRTPAASARIREAVAMVDIFETGTTQISVLSGRIEAETEGGSRWLYAGESMSVDADRYASVSPVRSEPDEWERWNKWRDGELKGSYASARHLPRELHEYARDFDREGGWHYVREYGYVWVPTVSISIGWAPYKHGRWAWRHGSYVWVSFEPWGWAPYHYGRWAYVSETGWCWVPPRRGEVYWGPGYVAWIYQPTYVAWVPLAPGEIYYGYGYYGPKSVNIVNININKTVIKFQYKNVRIRNAVTIVQKNAFIKGKRVAFRLKQNPFLTERPHVGPPRERHRRHEEATPAGKFRDRRRPPEDIVKHKTKERWRPGKPILFKGVSVKREAPRVDTPKRRKTVPSVKRNINRPPAAGKGQGPHVGSPRGRPEREKNVSLADRRVPPANGKHGTNIKWRPEKPAQTRDRTVKRDAPGMKSSESRITVPSVKHGAKRPPAVVTKKKPTKAEAKIAPKTPKMKAPASGGRHVSKSGIATGETRRKENRTPNVKGGPTADEKGIAGKLFRFSERGARNGKFR